MQCQGRTRTGRRCRNRSLGNELFCDIHMRVNHTYNLSLLIPLLLGLLAAYLFLFGLFFDTVVFGVFGINYLKYAGLEDLLLNMLRFGGMITLILILLWIGYIFLGIGLCGIWLLIRMIVSTRKSGLGFLDRLKVVSLSLLVYFFNIILMLIILFPKRGGGNTNKLIRKREKHLKSLLKFKDKSASPIKGKPFLTANQMFNNYLYFKSMGNQRLFLSILLLLVVSLLTTYYAGGKAEYARACALIQHSKRVTGPVSFLPFPAFILKGPCQISSSPSPKRDDRLTPKFLSSLTGYFDFTPMIIHAAKGQVALLHLATTSRFDLFFDGNDGRTLALPRGTFSSLKADQKDDGSRQSVAHLREKLKQMEQRLIASNQALFGIGKDLKKTNENLKRLHRGKKKIKEQPIEQALEQQISNALASLPASCWQKTPNYFLEFMRGSHVIQSAETLDFLIRLSIQFRNNKHTSIVLLGFADPPGGTVLNFEISKKRAQHVAHILEKLGVNQQRLIPIGLGENKSTLLPQRRVEIRTCTID